LPKHPRISGFHDFSLNVSKHVIVFVHKQTLEIDFLRLPIYVILVHVPMRQVVEETLELMERSVVSQHREVEVLKFLPLLGLRLLLA
jgi:hypothetical protein